MGKRTNPLTWVLLIGACLAPPARAQGPFADVPASHWAYGAVNELAQRGLVNGYPDASFGGARAMSRYELATVFHRLIMDMNRGPLLADTEASEAPGESVVQLPFLWQVYEQALSWPADFEPQRRGSD